MLRALPRQMSCTLLQHRFLLLHRRQRVRFFNGFGLYGRRSFEASSPV